MGARELRLSDLLGRRVVDVDGRPIGRLEEVVVHPEGADHVVHEYHVGRFGAFERIGGVHFARAALRVLWRGRRGWRVPWDALDLADPTRPRLLRPAATLPALEG